MVSKDKLKEVWRTAPRGIILWNACIIGLLMLTPLINIETFLVIQAIGSSLAFVIMLNEDLKGVSNPMNFWTNTTFTGWVVLIGKGVITTTQFIYKWTFGYLIKRDEIRLREYRKEQAIKRFKQFKLNSEKRKELLKTINGDMKNNQNLLGN